MYFLISKIRKISHSIVFFGIVCFVHGQNLPPIGEDDGYLNLPNQVLTINTANGLLSNDSDPDGGLLFINPTPVLAPNSGTVMLNLDGSFDFTPTTGFFDPITFQYQVCDDGSTAELVSQLDFSTPMLTNATVGPNATSINPNTEQASCGIRTTTSGGSTGLDIVVPNTANIFNFTAFEIAFEYRDQEATADIVSGGNFRIYHIGANALGVRINVIDSNTGITTAYTQNLGNFASGSNAYVVSYNEADGSITKSVNGATTTYNVAPPFSPLDTSLASAITIGRFMDGAGNALPSLCGIQVSDKSSLCHTALVTINTATRVITNKQITYRVSRN